ncbi:hypothetical protein ACFRKB_11220 [Streptomyces scopuliridis]|uniref:hypothetical protein n=1 Tax=Streptomyces scopuliridis TaxID=452529 RepID=UPI0036900000
MPWISRGRLAAMRTRIEQLAEQRDEARTDAAAHLGAAKRTAVRNQHLTEQLQDVRAEDLGDSIADAIGYERRIVRLTRAVARLSAALTTQTRRADRLQQRLDDAVGITSPAVDSGDLWQQRRSDKPLPGPSGVKL